MEAILNACTNHLEDSAELDLLYFQSIHDYFSCTDCDWSAL